MAEPETDADIIAKLQQPGAGVPFLDGLMMRFIVGPFVAAVTPWDQTKKSFASVNRKILDAAKRLDDAQLARRVLVVPQYGLEDSSRYWSAAMVLEHLVIVGAAIKSIVISLSRGHVPDFEVEIAKVKPTGVPSPQEALRAFEDFTRTVMDDIDREVKDRKSKTKLKHPWFGPFTARQWHWLLAAHSVIHLNQIREIADALAPPKKPVDVEEEKASPPAGK